MRAVFVGLVVASVTVAAPVPKEIKQQATDQTHILGRWQRLGGTEIWEFFADGTAKLHHLGSNEKPIIFEMDPKATPKAFHWKPSWGTWRGVYEVTADELRIAIVSGNGTVPTEAKAGQGYEFYEFRKAK